MTSFLTGIKGKNRKVLLLLKIFGFKKNKKPGQFDQADKRIIFFAFFEGVNHHSGVISPQKIKPFIIRTVSGAGYQYWRLLTLSMQDHSAVTKYSLNFHNHEIPDLFPPRLKLFSQGLRLSWL